jgi:ribosomal protein S8
LSRRQVFRHLKNATDRFTARVESSKLKKMFYEVMPEQVWLRKLYDRVSMSAET